MPAHYGLRPDDGERVASLRKQPADPTKYQPVCGREWKSGCLTPTQHNDLLPKHEDFCFQRRSRSKQIDDEAKYQPDEIRHQAQGRPILYATPTEFNLRQGQLWLRKDEISMTGRLITAARCGLRERFRLS